MDHHDARREEALPPRDHLAEIQERMARLDSLEAQGRLTPRESAEVREMLYTQARALGTQD
jgi:hypothetical protein